jgi:DNA-binding CsgD family transcriptional regulator
VDLAALAPPEGLPPWPAPEDDRGESAVRLRLEDEIAAAEAEIAARSAGGDADLTGAVARLVALHDEREAAGERLLRRRLDALTRVHEAIARLRELRTAEAIIARAPAEVAAACGFDRTVLYRVSGDELMAESFIVRGRPEEAERLLVMSRAHPLRLDQEILEREMIRRRIPMAVQDAMTNPRTYKPLAHAYDTHSYCGAPIMPEGRVIGFVHGDHRLKPRRVDEVDRDALWSFAEGLGFVIERARLIERLRAQGGELRRLMRRAEAVVNDYLDAEIELVAGVEEGAAATRATAALLPEDGPADGPIALLSRREREVMALIGKGASNAQVAAQLVITEETAKTHVKRILRKLGASNRVEAATIWLKAQPDER